MMLAKPEPLPAWHTPAPRQRRTTSRASRQPHGLWGTGRRGLQESKNGEEKTNLKGEGGIREGAEVSPSSIPQKPRPSGAGTRAQRRSRGCRDGAGVAAAPAPLRLRGPAAGQGHRAPRPPGGNRRGLRRRPRSPPLPVPYLAVSGPVPSRLVLSLPRGGGLGCFLGGRVLT